MAEFNENIKINVTTQVGEALKNLKIVGEGVTNLQKRVAQFNKAAGIKHPFDKSGIDKFKKSQDRLLMLRKKSLENQERLNTLFRQKDSLLTKASHKDNLRTQRASDAQIQQSMINRLQTTGDNVMKFRNQMKALSFMFLTMGLSMLFAGMAIKRFGTTVLRSLFNSFKLATEGSKAYSATVGRLASAFEFLKFTIVDTFFATEVGTAAIKKLVEWMNKLSKAVQDHPSLAVAIVGGAAGLAILGTALVIVGQITTAASSVVGTMARLGLGKKGSTMKGVKAAAKAMVGLGPARTATGQFAKAKPGRLAVAGAALKGKGAGVLAKVPGAKGAGAMGKLLGRVPGFTKLGKVLFRILKVFGKLFIVITVITSIWDFFTGVIEQFRASSTKAQAKNENFAKGLNVLKMILKGLVGILIFVGKVFTFVFKGIGRIIGWLLVKIIELVGWISKVADNPVVKGVIGGVKKVGGWFKSAGKAIGFAHGGIVTSPTNALIGEAGPEAVIPLARGGQTNLGGVNVTVNVNNPAASAQQIGNAVVDNIQRELRRSGLGAGL